MGYKGNTWILQSIQLNILKRQAVFFIARQCFVARAIKNTLKQGKYSINSQLSNPPKAKKMIVSKKMILFANHFSFKIILFFQTIFNFQIANSHGDFLKILKSPKNLVKKSTPNKNAFDFFKTPPNKNAFGNPLGFVTKILPKQNPKINVESCFRQVFHTLDSISLV